MSLAKYIDHTILRPDCTAADVKVLCEEAAQYHFFGACIPPYFVKDAAKWLEGTGVKVVTVIGFPLGYSSTPSKVEEIKRALDEGAEEVDAVINLAALKSNHWSFVKNDIDSVTRAVHLKGKTIKIIVESGLLTDAELVRVCNTCAEVGVDFVKTSTGFNGTGATLKAVQTMRECLPKDIKIKASGGIRTSEDAQKFINAGANRIGSSSSIKIAGEG